MANSIKKKSNSIPVKKIKVNNAKNVEQVVKNNNSTILTGDKSNAVRRKPVVKKIEQKDIEQVKTVLKNDINKDVNAKKVKKSKNAKIEDIKRTIKKEESKKEIQIDNQDANVKIILTDLENSNKTTGKTTNN